ncbi:methylated-DNA--[protein]-cysteine S-methyltransferase [Corynebacterium heidelbergense]|nr:methylated-DNA--[protein]-cysteine S-methyltransferase [Corynebacterium heidelbergense]
MSASTPAETFPHTYVCEFPTPVGPVAARAAVGVPKKNGRASDGNGDADSAALIGMWFVDPADPSSVPGDAVAVESIGDARARRLLEDLQAALTDLFAGRDVHFDWPIELRGTELQKAVWEQLRGIPFGQTRTYGQLAAAIGRPTAARAVGQAVGKNPICLLLPCHRVVGAGGKLTGFAGGLQRKRALLELERTIGENGAGVRAAAE